MTVVVSQRGNWREWYTAVKWKKREGNESNFFVCKWSLISAKKIAIFFFEIESRNSCLLLLVLCKEKIKFPAASAVGSLHWKSPPKKNKCNSVSPSVRSGHKWSKKCSDEKMNRSKVVPNSPRVFPRNRCRPPLMPPLPPNPQKGDYFPPILTFEYLRRYYIFWHST